MSRDRDVPRGRRIRHLRKARKWTQVYVADQLGVSERSVQAWEQGEPPDHQNLLALARLLESTPEFILDGTTTTAPSSVDDIEGRVAWVEQRARQHDTLVRYGFREVASEVKTLTGEIRALRAEVAELRAEGRPSDDTHAHGANR